MHLTATSYGSMVCESDPGEASTGSRRISVTDQEAALLQFLACGRRVLEIGTGLGVSTRALANESMRVTTLDIDPWVKANVWPALPDNVTCAGFPDYDEFDMAFIDGEHTTAAVKADVARVLTVVSEGIIVVHDTKMRAVREGLGDGWHFLDTYHGLGIRYVGWDE